jgi:sugar O-acyltransferase (sialic acid O-acetyltransferase NeuD family)
VARRKLVIFGAGEIAELAAFYFAQDSDYEVAAFAVDREYAGAPEAWGRPLVAFDDVARAFAPDTHDFFVAVGYAGLNGLRRDRYLAAKAQGYRIATYLSSRATVWPGFAPGENCFILEDNTLQPYARVGDNVTLWSGNHIGHHSSIGSHCFIASHVVVSGGVEIGERCFIGVNATLRDHVKVGERCVIGAGALITEDAAADGVYAAPASERSRVPSSRLRKI